MKKKERELTFSEEVANSISHGTIFLLLIFFSPIIGAYTFNKYDDVLLLVSTSIFLFSLITMFLSSTIYHFMEHNTRHKSVLNILDHIFIYVAIAGSYTPIGLYIVGGTLGIAVVIVQWLIVLFGIFYKTLIKKATPKISMTIYIIMGWLAVIVLPTLFRQANTILLSLIFLGGVFYTVGAIIYARQFKYHHFIWHLFVMLGALTHLIGIIFFIH